MLEAKSVSVPPREITQAEIEADRPNFEAEQQRMRELRMLEAAFPDLVRKPKEK